MKKIFSSVLISLLFAIPAFGQYYSLFSPTEAKSYFTNANGCLIGMRIDSVKTNGTATVYFPFKTSRTSTSLASNVLVDTLGASWLGNQIIETPDHNSYLLTKWRDTFFIKNAAQAGEAWIAYNDSSDIYFMAKVLAIQPQMVGNVLDSVKIISLNAFQGGSALMTDSLNSFEFAISKHHGLVKALPFYFFPFYNHQQATLDFSYDYYLNNYYRSAGFKPAFTFNRIDCAYVI